MDHVLYKIAYHALQNLSKIKKNINYVLFSQQKCQLIVFKEACKSHDWDVLLCRWYLCKLSLREGKLRSGRLHYFLYQVRYKKIYEA